MPLSGRKREEDPTASRLPSDFCTELLGSLPERIAVIDASGRILAVSEAWRAFALATGADVRSTCEGADYLAICDAATGDDAEIARQVSQALREILAGKRSSFVIEYPCHGPEPGQEAWFELHAIGFGWQGMRFATLTHTDWTRGARAEHRRARTRRIAKRFRELASAYRMAVARLRRAEVAAGVAAFEMDLGGSGVEAPEALCALLGLSPSAQLDSAAFLAVVHPDDRPVLQDAFQRLAAEGGQILQEFRLATPEDRPRWLQLRGHVGLRAGACACFAGAVVDVTERREAEETLRRSERRYRALSEAGALIIWRADPSGDLIESRGWEALTGQPEAAMRGEGWTERVHPDDRATTLVTWEAARAAGQPAEAEFRVMTRAGTWRWVRARAVPVYASPDEPHPVEWVGVLEDVDQRRHAEERRELLAREVDHRARNVLAVVQAVLRLSRSTTSEEFADAIEGRVAALARAHALLSEGSWVGADLRAVLEGELAPYHTVAGPFVELSGPSTALSPAAAQALSMVFHELATNAAKYGALSRAEGRLSVTWRMDSASQCLLLLWQEHGAPPSVPAPSRRGFGSRVIETTVRHQLGGKVTRRSGEKEFTIELEAPLDRVLADY